MMVERKSLTLVTDLTEKDIRFVVNTILGGPPTGALSASETLSVIVYDMLKQLGYQTEHACSILKHFDATFHVLGCRYEDADFSKPLQTTVLQLLDNRFAFIWSNPEIDKSVFDFTTLESVEQIPLPVLSVAIVLPKLYQRVLTSLSSLRCRRSQEEARTGPRTAYEGVPERIDQSTTLPASDDPKTP